MQKLAENIEKALDIKMMKYCYRSSNEVNLLQRYNMDSVLSQRGNS